MAARPQRRAPTKMPATVPLCAGYSVALWSDRPPRVFAEPTPESRGRAHAIELRTRRDRRTRWQPCLTIRLSVDGRQVSRTLLRLLAEHCVIRRRSPLVDLVLCSVDGSCSIGSLRWVSRGDAARLRRRLVRLEDIDARAVALTTAASDACRANDEVADAAPRRRRARDPLPKSTG